jgi:hypothetical protein
MIEEAFLSTNEFSIYKNKNDKTFFTIEFEENSESLINSLIKTKLIIALDINDDFRLLSFRASSIKSLKKFLLKRENITYENALKMILSLTKQFQYLITREFVCFYEFIIENIIVIDDEKFVYLSNEDLLKLSDQNKIQFVIPFGREGLISPELLKIKSIPSELNYKTIYYSLGVLIVYFLFDKNINNDENKNTLNEILKPIKGTKLFGLLNRCLLEEPDSRTVIYL